MLREIGVRSWFRDDGEVKAETAGDVTVAVRDAPSGVIAAESTAALSMAAAPGRAMAPGTEPSPSTSASWPIGTGPTLAAAEWLVVDGPLEVAGDSARAAIQAEQQTLLANMLRAVGVTLDAAPAAGSACHWRLGSSGTDDLAAVLARVRPRCVLALGRAPAQALLEIDEPLGRLRGKVHVWRGLPVVVTFPLAYLLRNPEEKGKAWADLCLAAGALDTAQA